MNKYTLSAVAASGAEDTDPLHSLIREGAQQLIAAAVESELESMLSQYQDRRDDQGRRSVVRNGYLPERTIQTAIGDVRVHVPKVRDRSGSGIKFNSTLLPPYLKRARSLDELIPWLYLRGVSTGDFQDALQALLGEQAKGLSANTVARLKARWLDEYSDWRRKDLSHKRYVYLWADGVYSQVRMDDKLCLLVILGVTEHGRKELMAVEDGYRESEASWREVLTDLRNRGLQRPPKLAVGDGALGFWAALNKVFPQTRHQRCWVHKSANVLNKLPKTVQPKVKTALQDIYLAETREAAHKAFDSALERFGAKYPKAMECLAKDREDLLAFYDFPAEHRWKRIKGFKLLELVVNNVKFHNGEQVDAQSQTRAA